jgi:hypothetical protein
VPLLLELLQNQSKAESESKKLTVYSENGVDLNCIYSTRILSIFISKMQLFMKKMALK